MELFSARDVCVRVTPFFGLCDGPFGMVIGFFEICLEGDLAAVCAHGIAVVTNRFDGQANGSRLRVQVVPPSPPRMVLSNFVLSARKRTFGTTVGGYRLNLLPGILQGSREPYELNITEIKNGVARTHTSRADKNSTEGWPLQRAHQGT